MRLENVFIKKSVLRQLKLPFVLKFGKVRLLSVFILMAQRVDNRPVAEDHEQSG